jgi:tellurite resistance protein TerC
MWLGFGIIVTLVLVLDLAVFNRRPRESTLKEAIAWTSICVIVSMLFGVAIWYFLGRNAGMEFFAGYLVEETLSVDNLFVFVLIFSTFRVPRQQQHRILFWGVVGALAMRGALIGAGVYLIETLHWVIYVFGAFLILAGLRLLKGSDMPELKPEEHPVLKLIRRYLPVSRHDHGASFFVREPDERGGLRWALTPLFVVLVLVETTDLMFALDSIPAIFGVTRDPFIVYSSNVCAVLGLRAIYFVLAHAVAGLQYLRPGLAAILSFVGAKMLLSEFIEIPVGVSLAVIASILTLAVAASFTHRAREQFVRARRQALRNAPVLDNPRDAPVRTARDDQT